MSMCRVFSCVVGRGCLLRPVRSRRLESPLDCKKINSVNPKGNQSWIGRTDAEAETPILWPPDGKNWLIGKDPDVGKDWRQEKKGDDREWDGWMASMTPWTWVWVISGSWWWTGKSGMLQSIGVTKSWTWLSDWTDMRHKRYMTLCSNFLEKKKSHVDFVNKFYQILWQNRQSPEQCTHSSILIKRDSNFLLLEMGNVELFLPTHRLTV